MKSEARLASVQIRPRKISRNSRPNSRPGDDAGNERAIGLHQFHAAAARPGDDDEGADGRAEGSLDERGDLGQRELDGDLIEAPAQAKRDRERGGGRIERPGCGRDVLLHHAARQCVQIPLISITGDFGVKPAARAADVSVEVTSADDASPTAPQRSQIRNTTSSPAA